MYDHSIVVNQLFYAFIYHMNDEQINPTVAPERADPVRCSIIVTCYNQCDYIREAVESALQQSPAGTEVIVVDDGSDDGSCEILESYGDCITFARMFRNGGVARARNHGASIATGDYLLFLDGDDVLMPGALEVFECIIKHRKPMLIVSQFLSFSGPVPWIRLKEVSRSRLEFIEYPSPMSKDRAAGLNASSLVVDRDEFLKVGGWTPDIFHGDIKDLIMKLGRSGTLILILSPQTTFYRIHEKNSIHNIKSFLKSAHLLIINERAGRYSGGETHVFERYAVLGVYVIYWAMKGLTAGLWKDVLKLVVVGLPMIFAGIIWRCALRLKGRRPVEAIDISNLCFQEQFHQTRIKSGTHVE